MTAVTISPLFFGMSHINLPHWQSARAKTPLPAYACGMWLKAVTDEGIGYGNWLEAWATIGLGFRSHIWEIVI